MRSEKEKALMPESLSKGGEKSSLKVCDTNIPQSPKKSTASDGRYRQWTIVVYPESAPDNWRDLLIGLIWIESPLHDKDLNPDGTPKKPHWHIFISFDGKKSYEQVKEIADSVCGASPQYVQNAVEMVRYFAHLDNPEKAQYDPKGIIGHGIDPKQYIESTADYDRLMIEITQFVRENHITEYADLCYETLDLMEAHPDWFKCVSTHTIHFKALVSSQRHRPMPTQKAEDDVSAIVDECVKEGGTGGN